MNKNLFRTWLTEATHFKVVLCLLLAWTTSAALAQQAIRGKVIDAKGQAIVGASAVLKDLDRAKGATTGADGSFVIDNLASGTYTVVISSIGFTSRELKTTVPGGDNLTVKLDETASNLNEVVVTGVFDKRERMDASIAISTLSAAQIQQQVPNSAADLLKNVPGVYVNSSAGEIRNAVYSRGVSANSTTGNGYYYVSLQEDGLPVTNATFGDYGPDFFLRADATLGRLEAVRGGSAAITGPNAPGGIFNYVSKTGGQAFEGEVRAKYGLEGNQQPFYRADVNLSGKLNEKGDLTFNAGGFYRYSNGARYAGYPLNNGGQLKFNVVKTYGKGSLKVYAKYLNDRNGFFDALPATNFDTPQVAAGLKNTDTFLPNKSQTFDFPLNSPNNIKRFDPADLVHSVERAVGLDWQHNLGNGWSFQNNVKYSSKTRDWSTQALIAPVSLTELYPYYIIGGLGTFGSYTFKDHLTGNTLANVLQLPNISPTGQFLGFNFMPTGAVNVPGQNIQPNSVLFTALNHNEIAVNEVMDQGSVTKKFSNNFSLTTGVFLGVTNIHYVSGIAGGTLSTIENQPHQLDISAVGFDGKTYQFTNPQGIVGVGGILGGGFNTNDYRQRQLSSFTGFTWKVVPKLIFDGGVRYENLHVKGTNLVNRVNPDAATPGYGGLDGNPLTVFDNGYGVAGLAPLALEKTIETISYSGALNFRWAQDLSLYVRYSDGRKAPDLNLFIGANTPFTAANLIVKAQRVQQVEAGIKVQREKYNVFATPFYSLLSNIPTSAVGQNTDNTLYNTPAVFNSIETYGLELESTYNLTEHFSLRSVITLQKATAKNWGTWILGNPGAQDDVVQSFSGNRAENVPNVMLNFTPNYTIGKLSLFGNYRYMGNRAANVANTFLLPSFSQIDAGFGYTFSKSLSLQGNVNNVFNSIGVMGWAAPGGFPASLDNQGFTRAKLEANPNAAYTINSIQPRAYYLTAIYKF